MRYLNYNQIIEDNKKWASEKLSADPLFFHTLAKDQKPNFLFISCSDSRVPVTSLTKVEAGEVFVHRNIANQVVITDLNLLSVLEYSVEILKVHHVIVFGHYKCGGIKAAVDGIDQGLVENWVSPIRNLYQENKKELESYNSEQEMLDRLSEINVIEQVKNIVKTPCMQRAFKQDIYPLLHGWIFDIYTGLIKDLKLPLETWKKMNLIPEDYK
jgi:carbonic anhydrase